MTSKLKKKGPNNSEASFPSAVGIDYLYVARDLENSIKGVVQRIHKFSPCNPIRDTVMF